MAINAKVTKGQPAVSDSEKLFKLLESMDWKLWEMYQILKAQTDSKKPKSKEVNSVKIKKTDSK